MLLKMSLSSCQLFLLLNRSRSLKYFKPINSADFCRRSITYSSFLKKNASFEDVKNIKKQKGTILIDVREPQELQETGVLPYSINIPLGDVESVLRDMPPDQFKTKYGKPKPESSTSIIFSCKSGKRSGDAQEIATKLGFKNTKNFQGGWLEWEEKIKNS